MPHVILESSDGEKYKVDVKLAELSGTMKTMLENFGVNEEDGKEDVVPLPNVRGEVLKLVIKWSEHHQDDAARVLELDDVESQKSQGIPEWDEQFLKIGHGLVFDLILASNYLDIKGLLDVTCHYVANIINGKTADELRITFDILDDLTDVEKEQIEIENSWCSEK